MGISKQELHNYLSQMYGIFGRSAPNAALQEIIHTQAGAFPGEFFEWACKRFFDLEKLPANVGRYLLHDLWPEWKRTNPQQVRREHQTCQSCEGPLDLPGFGFYVWLPDENGHYWRHAQPCPCAQIPHESRQRGRTKREVWDECKASGVEIRMAPRGYTGNLDEFDREVNGLPARKPKITNKAVQRALANVGRIDPMGQDPRRLAHLPEREQAEVTR